MDAETWLLEPYLLKVSQLHWTLVRSTGGGGSTEQLPNPGTQKKNREEH